MLNNGLGRYAEAIDAAREACEYEDFGFYNWSLYELVEAATRGGDKKAAAQALRRLEERAGSSETDWGRGAVACAQATARRRRPTPMRSSLRPSNAWVAPASWCISPALGCVTGNGCDA